MSAKRFVKVTAFLLVFVVLFLFCSSVFLSNSNNTRSIQGLYAEPKDSIDVLFVGASSVKTNFSAPLAYEKFGFTSYTLSFDGTAFEMLEPLLKECLKTQSPKAVIIELKPVSNELTNQKARAVIDNIKWSDNKKETIKKYASEDSDVSFLFTLDKYHARWKDISSVLGYHFFLFNEPRIYDAYGKFSLKELFIDKKHILRGFYTTSAEGGAKMYKAYDEVTEKVKVTEQSEKALYSMMKYLKDNNINASFLISPFCYSKGNVERSEIPQKVNYAKEIVEKNGFKVYDYRSDEFMKDLDLSFATDYGDYLHMNYKGAIKFTEYFGNVLDETFDLPDHRGDKTYDSDWQRSVEVMHNVVKYQETHKVKSVSMGGEN